MQQLTCFAGDCIIYAAALEAPSGDGFLAAALVVTHQQTSRVEIFRDEQLEDGRVWHDSVEAVRFAARVGTAAAGLYAERVLVPAQNRFVHRISTREPG